MTSLYKCNWTFVVHIYVTWQHLKIRLSVYENMFELTANNALFSPESIYTSRLIVSYIVWEKAVVCPDWNINPNNACFVNNDVYLCTMYAYMVYTWLGLQCNES